MDGMQLRLCFVTSLLSWTLLRFCVSESLEGKVLDLNTNLILLGKWPRSSPAVRRAFFACFSLFFFLSHCLLATFHSAVKNRRYRVFLDCKLTKLERGSQQTPYLKILFEAVFGKVFTQTRECLEGTRHSSSHFYGPWNCYLLILNDFPLKFTVNLKRKKFHISCNSWAHQQWSHKFYFRQLSDDFPDRSTIMKDKKQWF